MVENQEVRIPHEFEFEGEEAIMRKEGDRLIIEQLITFGRILCAVSSYPLGFPGG
jgi:antitoxin VapB